MTRKIISNTGEAIDLAPAAGQGVTINQSAVAITTILDEDNMVSDSNTALCTQQSIKAYVDAQIGGGGDVSGPGASTDNAIARFDGTDGKTIQNSGVTIDDSDVVAGITQLNVDNLRLDANSIISTDTDGDVTIEPNGTGAINLNSANVLVETNIVHSGDANNLIAFGTDTQDFQTGGASRLDMSDTGVRLGGANARVTTILDEDNMVSDSAIALATQQSIKAYVDANAGIPSPGTSTNFAVVIWDGTGGDALTESSVTINPGTNAIEGAAEASIGNLNLANNSIISTDVDGDVTIEPNGNGNINLNAANVLVETNIVHAGDANNLIAFGTDTQDFQTGGTSRMDISDSGLRLGAANARVTTILDEDNMASDSPTALCTQQSIKAYVDANVGGDVSGPGTSVDNTLPRFDGTTGKVIQDSGIVVDDADAMSGLTALDVDNININGNTISSTDTDGNINLTPDGNGVVSTGAPVQAASISFDAGTTVLDTLEFNQTFTPTLAGAGTAGSPTGTFEGTYTRIGPQVTARVRVVLTGKGGMAGAIIVGNLPYSVRAGADNRASITVGYRDNWTNSFVVGGYAIENTATIALMNIEVDAIAVDAADLSDTSEFYLSVTYETAA